MNIQMNDDNVYHKVDSEHLSKLLKKAVLILKDEIDLDQEQVLTAQIVDALNNLKITMDNFDDIIKPNISQERKLSVPKNMIISHQLLIQVFINRAIDASDQFYNQLQQILESFTVFYPIFIINNQLCKLKQEEEAKE